MNEPWAPPPLKAQLVLTGTLECRDKDGNLLQTIDIRGAIPLDLTDEEDHGDRSE